MDGIIVSGVMMPHKKISRQRGERLILVVSLSVFGGGSFRRNLRKLFY